MMIDSNNDNNNKENPTATTSKRTSSTTKSSLGGAKVKVTNLAYHTPGIGGCNKPVKSTQHFHLSSSHRNCHAIRLAVTTTATRLF
jgi:hypothetical protein